MNIIEAGFSLKGLLGDSGAQILILLVPILMPNRMLYPIVRKTIGKFISFLTVKSEAKTFQGKLIKGLWGYIINTIVTVASAISDEARGVPMGNGKAGSVTASEYAATPPKTNGSGAEI